MTSDERSRSAAPTLTRVAGGSALYLLAGKVFTLLTILLLSTVLPLAAFGEFIYARGMVLFLGPFMAIGLTVTAIRRIPTYMAQNMKGSAAGFMRTVSLTVLTVSTCIAVLLALAAPVFLTAERATILAIALIGLPGYAALVAHMQVARAAGRVRLAYAPLSLGQPLLFAGLVGYIAIVTGITEPGIVTVAFVATLVVMAAVQALSLWRMHEFRGVQATYQVKTWLSEAAPLTVSLAAQGFTVSGPLLILGFFAEAEMIGIFGFYQAAMQGILVFNTAIFGAANPRLSQLLAKGARDPVNALLRRSRIAAATLSLAAALIAGAMILNFGWIIDPAFTSQSVTMALLFASVPINALAGPLGHVLVIEDRAYWEISVQVVCAVATLVLACVAIPLLGLVGAALATLLAAILRVILMHILVYGRLGYRL